MLVRPFQQTDSTAVRTLFRLLYPGQTTAFDPGRAWVVEDGRPLGCLTLTPVPGLGGVFDLDGGVHPHFQRQGVGSLLWTAVRPQLPALGVKQISHAVTDLNSPAAHFLRRRHFFVEHEEWLMRRPLPAPRSPLPLPLHTLPRARAIRTFLTLYDQSFGGRPWYQPYPLEEVAKTLADPEDMLFLLKREQPIGFAWLQEEMIEPIGIVKGEQGQGYGRLLLHAVIYELEKRGAKQAQIGVWRDNETAVRLYQSLGFQQEKTATYLALDLP